MGAEEGEALLNLVQSKECCLTELKISASGLHSVIPQILTLSTSLESLYISKITIDDLHDVDHLSNNISTLYLHSDHKMGAFYVFRLIANNESLEELGLNMPINEHEVDYIRDSLCANTTLKRLKLPKWALFMFFKLLQRIDSRVEFGIFHM